MIKKILRIQNRNWGHPLNWFLGLIFLSAIIYMVWNGFQLNNNQPLHLVVYAFSTQEEVLTQGIFPAFEQAWEAETGEDVVIDGVFGPSGTLAGQITLGAPADIAIFSNQRHVELLKFSKFVDKDANQVMIASSPLVILTRPDNPKGISDFKDLAQPGIQLLHPDPGSSGAGEWGLLVEYGNTYLESGDQKLAESKLKDIWSNVRLMGSSARVTLTIFELGAGDALVTYEQDARLAQERGVPLEIILPNHTILTRHYAVIVDDNVTFIERPLAEAFMAYIRSDEGQQILRQYYFRPPTIDNEFVPALVQTFTEEDLGGWTEAYNRIIENYWKTEIEPDLGFDPSASFLVRGD